MATTRRKVARTPEEQDNILMNLASKLAKRKLEDGTATSQLICTILTNGSQKKQLETDRLKAEVDLLKAKVEQIHKESETNETLIEVLSAFKGYQGKRSNEEDEYYD